MFVCPSLIHFQGHTNNLAHPVLSELIMDFFYSGTSSVRQLFPEVFAAEVPRVTVAIVRAIPALHREMLVSSSPVVV